MIHEFFITLGISRYVTHHKDSSEMNVLLLEAVVEGYHEFPFTVMTGESFVN